MPEADARTSRKDQRKQDAERRQRHKPLYDALKKPKKLSKPTIKNNGN
jgi:hypothetical protein